MIDANTLSIHSLNALLRPVDLDSFFRVRGPRFLWHKSRVLSLIFDLYVALGVADITKESIRAGQFPSADQLEFVVWNPDSGAVGAQQVDSSQYRQA